MFMIIRQPTGRRTEAILLAADQHHMRVVVRRLNETMELVRKDGRWLQNGRPVEIECCLVNGEAAAQSFCSSLGHRVSTAAN